jgi:ketosteroid isomerase-like protein
MASSNADTVRASFDAYLAQDRDAIDRLLSDDLVFTSPQDDHIDKVTYFERCFPTTSRLRSQQIVHVVEAGSDGVFLMYEYELVTGERYRNTEFITVRAGRITDIQVFFGGRVTPS